MDRSLKPALREQESLLSAEPLGKQFVNSTCHHPLEKDRRGEGGGTPGRKGRNQLVLASLVQEACTCDMVCVPYTEPSWGECQGTFQT